MATYNGNDAYLDIDGTSLGTYFREVAFSQTVEAIDTTAGSSTTYRERQEGLKDTSGTITIVYDTAVIQTHLALIKPGVHTLTYGPRGNTAGMEKHVQSIIITELPHTVNVEKPLVAFAVPFVGAAAPTVDMAAGGVWS